MVLKKKIKIKKLQKTKMKTLYASKEENEEMSISKTKYPRGCIYGTWSLRCKDCMTSIWVYFSVQLVPSLLASFHQKYSIQNAIDTQRMRNALHARQGSRSCKNIAQARERWHLENAIATYEKDGGWAPGKSGAVYCVVLLLPFNVSNFPFFSPTQPQFSHVCLSSWWEVTCISLVFVQKQTLVLGLPGIWNSPINW